MWFPCSRSQPVWMVRMPALPLTASGERRKGVGLSQGTGLFVPTRREFYPTRIAPYSSRAITLLREAFRKYRGFRHRFVVSPYILGSPTRR